MMSEFEKNISGRIANLTIPDSTMTNKVELPDLIPYKPKKWDGAIVISTQPETKTDAEEITTEDSLYIDWAAINRGSVNTVNTFHTRLFLDGSPIKNWYSNPPLKPNFYSSVRDFKIDALPAGNHTLTLEVDYQNEEPESNEENNVFEKEFTVVPGDLPDLVPYQPDGWDGPIVISTQRKTNTDAEEITTEDSLYVDWAALNQGSVNTVNTIHFRLSLDGSPIKNWSGKPPLKPNKYNFFEDFKLDPLSAGNHTLTLEVDSRNKEPESNEENNIFEKEFTVVPAGTEFNINQFGDSTNPGSLRHAIIQANNSAENDVINLAEGTYTLSLEGLYENDARTGDLDIADNGTLTIQGLGNGAVIDAQEIDRIFDIAENATLILENVTVVNGNAPANWRPILRRIDEESVGGGILVGENSSLILIDSTVSNNKTIHTTAGDDNQGGGIFVNTNANVTITNSTIADNGLFNDDGTILENQGSGGGIYIRANATASITDSLITQNQAWNGGGIANRGKTTLDNTEVSFNHSQSSGAGIYNYRGSTQNSSVTLNLNNSLITQNQKFEKSGTDTGGGGIYNYRADVTLNNTKVSNNYSRKAGGGIFSDGEKDKPGKLVITNQSEISNNTAVSGGYDIDWGGGGIFNGENGIMEVSDSLIDSNELTGSKSGGGGIYNIGLATLNRLTITDNNGSRGGGIAQDITGKLSLTDSVVEENTAVSLGGGLFLDGEAIIIENSFIRNNQTTDSSGDGGGIHVDDLKGRDATITNTIIADNQAADHGGGINNERDLTLINTQIINNQAQDGGGVYHDRSSLLLIDSNIDNNQAINGNGGGFHHSRGLVNVINSSITNNIATTEDHDGDGRGGGIFNSRDVSQTSDSNTLNLIGSTVAGNTSFDDGAGIYNQGALLIPGHFFSAGITNAINSTIIRNIVDVDDNGNGNGGGIFNESGVNLNDARDFGIVNLKNTVIAYNQTGLRVVSDVDGDGKFNANNNNLIGNTNGLLGFEGTDLLDIDPLLGPLQDNGNGRLTAAPLAGSPLIDAGYNDNLPADTYDLDGDGDTDELLPLDGRGDDRIQGERVDIGAVEGTDTAALVANLDLDGDEQGSLVQDCLNIQGLGTYDLISNLMQQLVVNLIAYGLNGNGITGAELSEFLGNHIM